MLVVTGGISIIPPDMQVQSNVLNARFIMMLLGDAGVPENFIDYILSAIDRIYSIIKLSGVQILIFLAALQSVSPTLYEVSKVEGATSYETLFKVTLPMISPMILTNVVYTIIDSYITSPIVTVVHDTAFKLQNYGLSAAMSIISTFSVCLILLCIGFILNKFIYYQN